MGKKKNKIDKYAKRRLLVKIILVILIVLLLKIMYFTPKNITNKETILIIGDKVEQLDNKVIVDSFNNIYVSYDDIKKIYDENIYYDEANKKLITTYNKHIALLELNKKKIIINDAESEINGELCFLEDKLYLPLSDMELVYDIECEFQKSTNIVIIDNISKEKLTVTTIKKVKVKNAKKEFSKTVSKQFSDNELVLLKKEGKYLKIRTSEGIIGYIKSNKASKEEIIRTNMDESKLENVNILKKYSEIEDNYDNITVDLNKYNVVAPKVFKIVENKNLEFNTSTDSEKYKKYISWVEENKLNLWATITNEIEVSEMLLTYDDRNILINNIYAKLIQNKFKVLNIDFKKINDINSFYRFLIEITPKLRESGIKTVVTYNENINKEKIENIVDYIVKED